MKRKRRSILLPLAERRALGAAAKPEPAGRCPSCKGLAVKKGKRWWCRRSRKAFGRKPVRQSDGTLKMERVKLDNLRYLICGAKGVVMSDGTLAVTSGGAPQPKEEE